MKASRDLHLLRLHWFLEMLPIMQSDKKKKHSLPGNNFLSMDAKQQPQSIHIDRKALQRLVLTAQCITGTVLLAI